MNFDPLALSMVSLDADLPGRAQPARDEKESIWKRELSFRRRRQDAAPAEEPIVLPAPAGGPPSFASSVAALYSSWEELGLISAAKAHEPEPELETEPEAAPAEAKPSIWKRELSFRGSRKAGAQTEARPEPEPEPAAEDGEPAKPSLWKRELTFRRSRGEASEPDPETEAEPKPIVEPEVAAFDDEEPLPEPAPELPPAAVAPEPPAHPARPSIWDELGIDEPAAPEPPSFESQSFEPQSFERTSFEPGPAVAEPESEPEPEDVQPEAAVADEAPEDTEEPAERKRRGLARRARREPKAKLAKEPKVKQPKEPRAKKPKAKRSGSKRAVKIVGLKLGASQIAAAHIRNNGSIDVLKVARMPLEKGVVVAGEVRDPDMLAEALRAFFKGNKLPKRGVRLGIASNRVGVRTLDVVGVDDPALLPNAVRFRAQEVLPIPLTDAVLDYRVLDEEVDEAGETHRRVLVAFAYRELVDRYLAACKKAGIRLVGIDLEGFALLRALVDPAEAGSRPAGAAVVTAALGHDRSIMSVSDGTVCEFTRVIEWGGGALDTAVARILALTPSQAEPIKRALTLDPTVPTPEGLNDEQAQRARNAMLHEANAFARELVSSLQFYQGQPGSLDIGEIVVTGGAAHMRGLVAELQRLTGVGVRLGDPLVRVSEGSKNVTGEEQLGSLALAIGLGIED